MKAHLLFCCAFLLILAGPALARAGKPARHDAWPKATNAGGAIQVLVRATNIPAATDLLTSIAEDEDDASTGLRSPDRYWLVPAAANTLLVGSNNSGGFPSFCRHLSFLGRQRYIGLCILRL